MLGKIQKGLFWCIAVQFFCLGFWASSAFAQDPLPTWNEGANKSAILGFVAKVQRFELGSFGVTGVTLNAKGQRSAQQHSSLISTALKNSSLASSNAFFQSGGQQFYGGVQVGKGCGIGYPQLVN